MAVVVVLDVGCRKTKVLHEGIHCNLGTQKFHILFLSLLYPWK